MWCSVRSHCGGFGFGAMPSLERPPSEKSSTRELIEYSDKLLKLMQQRAAEENGGGSVGATVGGGLGADAAEAAGPSTASAE